MIVNFAQSKHCSANILNLYEHTPMSNAINNTLQSTLKWAKLKLCIDEMFFSCINTLVFGPLNGTIMSRTLGPNTHLLPQYPPHPQQYTLTWLACNLESSHPGLWLHWFLYAWKAVLVCNNAYLCYVPELCVGGGSRMSVAETYLSGGWKLFKEFNKDIWVG